MTKFLLNIFFLFSFIGIGKAQSAFEALRYSSFEYGGTARSLGTAGVLGAFGGDFSVVSTNPAGLAVFRGNELVITPGFYISNTDSDFENIASSDNKNAFHIGNLGAVFNQMTGTGNWKSVNFGIGLNRINNFHQKFSYDANSAGTIADYFVNLAQGFVPNDLYVFEEALAFDTGLIYRPFDLGLSDDETYYENDFFPGDIVRKKETVEVKGYMDEMTFAGAGNYKHKWYFGAAIGLVFLEYDQTKTYEELDDTEDSDDAYAGSIPYFNGTSFEQNLLTSGFGTNFKLGVNYRFNQQFRLGIAIHTPTFLNMDDFFSNSMETDITYFELDENTPNERSILTAESETGEFSYSLRTPWRYFLNAGLLIGKKGFISAELEYVDYTSPRFRFTDQDAFEAELTQSIEQLFNANVLNVRIGTEWRLKDFRVRGGVGLFGEAIEGEAQVKTTYHTGLGYRSQNYFIDLGYRLERNPEEQYFPYISPNASQPEVRNANLNSNILLTFGFKF